MKGQCADRVFVASGRQVLKVGGTILVAGTSREDLERRSKAESAGLVFTMESGTAVDPRSALRPISTAAKALGISDVGTHTLRYSICHAHARGRRATAYGLGATRALLRRGHRGRARPRLQPARAFCRPAALSSNGLVRTFAVATRGQRGRLGFCPKRPLMR